MRVGIYGRQFNHTVLPYVQHVFNALAAYDLSLWVYQPFNQFVKQAIVYPKKTQTFATYNDIKNDVDLMISLGGDGSMLDTVVLIRDSMIPIAGINFGRLGFLASVSKDVIEEAIKKLVHKEYILDPRTLLNVESEPNLFGEENFALNDITIHRRDNSAMMIIHAYLNGEFLNSYWADGLIIATPTGSTAYSLSCGGPIVLPGSGNLVLTPIAPHNLNVRPIVFSDTSSLTFEIEGRSSKYLLTCDSRTKVISNSIKIEVSRSRFCINLVQLETETYLSTLRKKLLWGLDTRNYELKMPAY